jgi:DNA-binding PadR family transcriptional regulator
MGKDYLGELEELILTVVGILGDDAYGNAIVGEIKQQLNRTVSLASAHVTLYRLQDKGYVKSIVGGATNKRGGRSKRIFRITSSGVTILKSMKHDRLRLWNLTPQLR